MYLVDDEPLILETLSSKMRFLECGFQIVGASPDPVLAMEEIKELRPHVVITDLKMPVLTGIQLMEELKSCGCASEFVILSAYNEFKDVRRFFTGHGFDYVVKPVSDEDLVALLRKLSDKLGNIDPKTDAITPSGDLNEILRYLREHYAMKHSLESLGQKYDINPTMICNLFAKHLQTTFIAYITEIRMEKAEKMLLTSTKSVKEIATLCGYNDYFYFCRVFREQRQTTPTKFRNEGMEARRKSEKKKP